MNGVMIPEKRGEILQIFDSFGVSFKVILIGKQAVIFAEKFANVTLKMTACDEDYYFSKDLIWLTRLSIFS